MHVNSLLAYWQGKGELFSERENDILRAVGKMKRATDREVMLALGFADPNKVRPRITEMLSEGLLEEIGNIEDPISGKTVRVLGIKRDPRKAQREFEFASEGTAA